MLGRHEGAGSVELLRYWRGRSGELFCVRDPDGRLRGFAFELRLDRDEWGGDGAAPTSVRASRHTVRLHTIHPFDAVDVAVRPRNGPRARAPRANLRGRRRGASDHRAGRGDRPAPARRGGAHPRGQHRQDPSREPQRSHIESANRRALELTTLGQNFVTNAFLGEERARQAMGHLISVVQAHDAADDDALPVLLSRVRIESPSFGRSRRGARRRAAPGAPPRGSQARLRIVQRFEQRPGFAT
jgi:hypothetical protein